MKDGVVRRALKAVARAGFDLNQALDHALRRRRGERPYVLGGACERCAKCCEAPSIQVGRLVWYAPALRKLFLAWQRHVNGFELVQKESPRTLVFRCTHFDSLTRMCDSYESRPGMCRDYPRALLWQVNPELFDGCGYRAVDPKAKGLLRALERKGVSAEQLETLKKKLHLGS